MVNWVKDHWLCFMVGGVVGWCLHLCPLFGDPVAGQKCERDTVCACDACACDVCDCDGAGCGCPNCVVKE